MERTDVARAVKLAARVGDVLVATADRAGVPHVTTAGEPRLVRTDALVVATWLCPRTMANLDENRNVALVIWDREEDEGYELTGVVEELHDRRVLSGHAPEVEVVTPVPQFELMLSVRVTQAVRFRRAGHTESSV